MAANLKLESSWKTLAEARTYALAVIRQAASLDDWSSDLVAWANAIVDGYAEDNDGYLWDDIVSFWRLLAEHFTDAVDDGSIQLASGAVVPLPSGLDTVVSAYELAYQHITGKVDEVLQKDVVRKLGGLLVETVDEVAETIRDTARDAKRNRRLLVGGGVLAFTAVIGLAIYKRIGG